MTELELAMGNALTALLRAEIERDKARIEKVLPMRTLEFLQRAEIELKEAMSHD